MGTVRLTFLKFVLPAALVSACQTAQGPSSQKFDLIIRSGTILDGSGLPGFHGDVAVNNDRITQVSKGRIASRGRVEIDATGMMVAPGFINTLSHAEWDLLADGRGESDVRQGVTLEIFGEDHSIGPWTEAQRVEQQRLNGSEQVQVSWHGLGEGLEYLAARGVSPNIASTVGASTIRANVLGLIEVTPDPAQLAAMRALVREAMLDGALGLGTALAYVPGAYASTDELSALATESGRCGGVYASHLRSNSDAVLDAIEELLQVVRSSGTRGIVYHIQLPRSRPDLFQPLIGAVVRARAQHLDVSANMYPYAASSSGADSYLPLWAREGGIPQLVARLKDSSVRARILEELRRKPPPRGWAEQTKLAWPESPELKHLIGKSFLEIAAERRTSPEEVLLDLIVEDRSRLQSVFHIFSEDTVRSFVRLPWVSIGSDGTATTVTSGEGRLAHPRRYGTFARVLAKYARQDRTLTLAEAVRKMTSLPAGQFALKDRGRLIPGYYADLVVFDPEKIADRATFETPNRYSEGVQHVFVNGDAVIREGQHTGAMPGQVVRGPGWRGWPNGGHCPRSQGTAHQEGRH